MRTLSCRNSHEYLIYSAIGGRRQTARSTLLMHVVHLGRLNPTRKAMGQMNLLTVPSLDDADMRFSAGHVAVGLIRLLGRRTSPLRSGDR